MRRTLKENRPQFNKKHDKVILQHTNTFRSYEEVKKNDLYLDRLKSWAVL